MVSAGTAAAARPRSGEPFGNAAQAHQDRRHWEMHVMVGPMKAKPAAWLRVPAKGVQGLVCVLLGVAAASSVAQVSIEASRLEPNLRVQPNLDSALEVAVRHRAAWPDDDLLIRLPPGRTRLQAPLRLDRRLNGRQGRPVRLEGAADGSTVLSVAGLPRWVKGSELGADELHRLPSAARQAVWRAELPPGAAPWPRQSRHGQGHGPQAAPSEVLWRSRPMPQASWPAQGFARIEGSGDDGRRLRVPGSAEALNAQEPQAWLHGFFGNDWADEWIALDAVDRATGELSLAERPPLYGVQMGQRIRVVNVVSALDEPGEWVFSDDGRYVWFWPPEGKAAPDAELTASDHVLQVSGVSHLHVRDITFEGSRGDAVKIVGGRDVRVERSRFRNIGGQAVAASGTAHAVVDCDVTATGQGGVTLWGGDRQTLEPSGILVQGNRLRGFNRWLRTYRPAIAIGGVGHIVRGNLISDAPHAAIVFWGNDHLIELNVVSQVAQETGDVGAIYAGNDWTARGTVIRHNHLHDIRGPGRWGSRGIYLDDQLSGTVVLGNLFVDVDQPVFIGGGRDNLVDNNLFVRSQPPIHLDRRGRTWQRGRTDDENGPLRRALRERRHDRPPYSERYPGLARLLLEQPGEPRGNVARRNVVADGSPDRIEAPDGIEIERRFGPDETRFLSGAVPARGRAASDFALDPLAPAIRQGFSPLPLDAMACTASRWQAALQAPRIMCAWE
jgi:Right handed beta helix region